MLGFLQRIAAQLSQMLHVCRGEVASHFAEHRLVFHQSRAQSFQPVLPNVGCFRIAVDFVHRRPQGRGVDVAHDLADVLHLASFGFMLGEALRVKQCVAQALRHVDLRQTLLGQGYQFGAEVLQGSTLAFQLGFTRSGILVRFVIDIFHGYDYSFAN